MPLHEYPPEDQRLTGFFAASEYKSLYQSGIRFNLNGERRSGQQMFRGRILAHQFRMPFARAHAGRR